MSFASLKKASKSSFSNLATKMQTEKSGGGGGNSDDRYWQPDVDKSGNGYAVIRFLPSVDGEDMPYVKTYNHGFKEGTKWYIENCATTIGESCPVCDANNVRWATGLETEKEIVRKRKRKLSYIANIIVISDSKHPENEGKVFLFKFGAKIFAKIMGAIEPEFEDETAINPFDFWDGANFKLKIRNVESYRNYDKSEFDAPSQLMDGDDAALETLWKSQYPLAEIIGKDKFKPYAELQKKYDSVIGNVSDKPKEDDDDFSNFKPTAKKGEEDTPWDKTETKSDKKNESDDADLALYAKLLEDD